MRALLTFIILTIGIVAAPAAAQPPQRILTASTGEHLWIVRESADGDTIDLLAHGLDMGGPFASATVPLHSIPEGIAGFGERIWIVSSPRVLTVGSSRSVMTLRIRKRPEIDFYVTEPEGRFAILDTLPGEGELASITATAAGPAALLRYDRATTQAGPEDRSPQLPGSDRRAAPDRAGALPTYRLFKLRRDRWSPSTIPAHITLGHIAMLAADGPDLDRLNLLTTDPANPSRTLLYRRDARGWSAEPFPINIDLETVNALTQVRGRLAAITLDQLASTIEITYIRPGGALPLAQIPLDETLRGRGRGGWSIAGMNDGFRMIAFSDDDTGALTMRTIHRLTGELGPEHVITRPRLPAARLLHMTIMLTIAVVTVLLILIVRPGSVRTAPAGKSHPGAPSKDGEGGQASDGDFLELPKGVAILSPVSRTIALLIDLAPGGILALLILRAPPIELLRLPIVTNSLDQAAPYLIMIGIMLVHVTLSEMMKGTSLGKALMGGRVLSTESGPPESAGPSETLETPEALVKPTAKQALIRNILKLLILMVPPLAIFAFLSRNLQGFNDLLARTVVVGDLPVEEAAPSVDEDEE